MPKPQAIVQTIKSLVKRFVAVLVLCVTVGSVLGFWDILGRELYEIHIKERFRPAVVPHPNVLRFDRHYNYGETLLFVSNRSQETHFNIQIYVLTGGLKKEFERVELELPRPAEKPLFQAKDEKKTVMALFKTHNFLFPGGTWQFSDTKEEFVPARIGKLSPGEAKPLLVRFKSVGKIAPKPDQEWLELPVEVSRTEGIAVYLQREELPYRYIQPSEHSSVTYQGNPLTLIRDDQGNAWFLVPQICWLMGITDIQKAIDTVYYESKSKIIVKLVDQTEEKHFVISAYGVGQLAAKWDNPKARALNQFVVNNVKRQSRDPK